MTLTSTTEGLPPATTFTTLPNGLTIIVREDSTAPVVSAQAWCRTGSIHEGRWLGAGLSHVLEHMLFKGTARREGAHISQEVQDAGGYMNAYTSFDRTVYWINAPDTGKRVAIDVLCDIMQHATLPADTLAQELDVIRREMEMGQDDPGTRSIRRLFETAYTRSPYRHTVIGYLDIFNELKPEDIRSYYEHRYAPNNVFFVVAGDVKAAEVIEQIAEAYSKTKARPVDPIPFVHEPKQVGARHCYEEAKIELGHIHWSWHIPDVRDPEIPALQTLSMLLGHGRSSRLFQNVREKKAVVNSIDAWMYNPGNPGLFGISAMLEPAKLAEARDAIAAEVDRLRQHPVDPSELAKAVKQCVTASLATRKTMEGQAQELGGNWLAAGDLNFTTRYVEAVRRLTPQDLQQAAGRHLTEDNRTIYGLLPSGTRVQTSTTQASSEEGAIQLHRLPNGLRVLIKESRKLPFVEFRLATLGGVLAETEARNGAGYLLGRMMMQGTTRRSAEQLAREIESLSGSLDTYAGNNSFGATAEFLGEDFDKGIDFLSDVLLHPAYPADALERERTNQIAEIRSMQDQLLHVGLHTLARKMFGRSGYGLQLHGEEASVAQLAVEDLKAAHHSMLSPDRAVLAVFGNVNTDQVLEKVRESLGAWNPASGVSLEAMRRFAPDPSAGGAEIVEQREKEQAVVLMGFPGTCVDRADRHAVDLLQESCSDMGSRLFLRVRDQLGLAYYLGAFSFVGISPGFFAFYAGTAAEHASRVVEEFQKEVRLLRQDGLTDDELRRAKNKILGQRKIGRQDLGVQAMNHALDELYGLGYRHADGEDARFESVTREAIIQAARRYLAPEQAVVVKILPKK